MAAYLNCPVYSGVDHGGTGGTRPPRIWARGDSNVICPPTFGLYFWVERDERGAHTNSKSGSEATGMLYKL